jgi:hypothetical protein
MDQQKANSDALAQQNQAMQQMISQHNLTNQLQQQHQQQHPNQQQPQQTQGQIPQSQAQQQQPPQAQVKTEESNGQRQQNTGNGTPNGTTNELQAASLQALALIRNMVPNQQTMPNFAGMDPSQMQNAFSQQAGSDPNNSLQLQQQLQQLQAQSGQQLGFPMNFAAGQNGMAAPGAQFPFPLAFGGMPQQQMFQFPGAPAGIPNMMQNLAQPQQQPQQQQQQLGKQQQQ